MIQPIIELIHQNKLKKLIKNVNTFKSSFNINGNGPMLYQTDYRANYVPLSNKINPKEKKLLKM